MSSMEAPAAGGAGGAAVAAAASEADARFDNFQLMSPFIDAHLLFPWLAFLEQLGVRAARPRARSPPR